MIIFLKAMISFTPLWSMIMILKVSNSKRSFNYWNCLSTLYNLCIELGLRKMNQDKWGHGNLNNKDIMLMFDMFIRLRVSMIRHPLTFNPKYLFKDREDMKTLMEFADAGVYSETPIGEIEELMSKDQAVLYAHCMFVVDEYRKAKLHQKKNHIFRGILAE